MAYGLSKNRTVIKLAKKLLKLKRNHPHIYRLLNGFTDGVIVGSIVLVSFSFAIALVNRGLLPFDSAMMGIALFDANVLLLDLFLHPYKYYDVDSY